MQDTTRNTAKVNRKNRADGDEARLETPGGVLVSKWDETTAVSRHAFLAHFAAFLHAGGELERLAEDSPVRYASPNAPDVREVLATIVSGSCWG